MRFLPVYGVLIGLFWTGTGGAGPDEAGAAFCAAHGRMVRALADARANGTPEAAVRAALLTPHTPPAVRILMEDNIRRVYASTEPPDVLAARAEAVCRTVPLR